jgi:DNA-binding MarR family transcriptional regulator
VPARASLGNDLLRSSARLTRWASRHASFDVPYAQARLLALLDELGPSRVSTLADADHSSQPSMTTALQRLEAQGWAHRVADPADARASLLSLTPAGRAALEDVRAARLAVLAPLLDDLDEEDLTRLRGAVEVIDGLLDRVAAAPAPRTPVPDPTPIRKEA